MWSKRSASPDSSAGAGQLLAHGCQFGLAGFGAHLRDDPPSIGLCRRIGVDVQHRQARCAGHRRRRVAKFDPQHLVEVGRCIGADQQHLAARVGQLQRGSRRQRSLAHPPLAREEQVSRRVVQESRQVRTQPAQHFLVRWNPSAVHDPATDDDSGRVPDTRIPDGLRILDLHDHDLDPGRRRSPLDHRNGAAALAAAAPQNTDLHVGYLVVDAAGRPRSLRELARARQGPPRIGRSTLCIRLDRDQPEGEGSRQPVIYCFMIYTV